MGTDRQKPAETTSCAFSSYSTVEIGDLGREEQPPVSDVVVIHHGVHTCGDDVEGCTDYYFQLFKLIRSSKVRRTWYYGISSYSRDDCQGFSQSCFARLGALVFLIVILDGRCEGCSGG